MCQSAAEGGRRCAAHTRSAFTRALSVFGCEPDASKRARLVEEHKAAIIDHALTPKGKTEVDAAIARIDAAYEARPSVTAAEETGRAEYVSAFKLAQMQASLRGELEEASRRAQAWARTGSHGNVPGVQECQTGAVSGTDETQRVGRLRRVGDAGVTVHQSAQQLAGVDLSQRWFEQAAVTAAEGRYVVPRSGGATADTPVHLEMQTYTSVGVEGRVEKCVVTNRLLGASPTTCGKPGHSSSMVRSTSVNAADDVRADDCACDAACTHCWSPPGQTCTTNDGGGVSGGGYTTKSHSKRIKASARIQGLRDGTRSRCDFGDHQWVANADGTVATCSGSCGRTEPIHASSRRSNRLFPAGGTAGQG